MSIQAFALLWLAVVPCPSSAQKTPIPPWPYGDPCLPFEPQNTIEWPRTVSDPVDYGRIVIAELDGDQAPEGVAIEDGVAVAFWKMAVYDAPQVIGFQTKPPPANVGDIAALPGGNPAGRDAVLMTDGRGLFRVTWVNVPYPEPGYPGYFADPDIIAQGDWIGAAPIHVDDIDMNGHLDVIGISADGYKVMTLLGDGSGFQPGLTLTEVVPMRAVAVVDWNHDGLTRELVELSVPGLLVRHGTTGAVIKVVRYRSVTGCIARFRDCDDPGDEHLAWTRQTTQGMSQLVVIDQDGIAVDQNNQPEAWPLNFNVCGASVSVHPTALLAGDYDLDGDEELVLVHQGNRLAFVLANLGGVPHFQPQSSAAFDAVPFSDVPLGTGGVGIPAFGQVDEEDPDDDGPELAPLDLVFPVSATSRVEVVLGPSTHRALIGSGGYDSSDIVVEQTEFGHGFQYEQPVIELRLAFFVPSRYENYQHLDLVLWRESGPVQQMTVSTSGLSYRRHNLADANPSPTVHLNPPYQWVHLEHDFPNDSTVPEGLCWGDPKPAFYTEYRFVKVLAGGGEVKSPAFTGGFTLVPCDDASSDDFVFLGSQGIPGTSFFLREDNNLPGAGAAPRHVVGLYVPMSSQPPFAEGSNPQPGPRSPGIPATAFPN